MPVEFIGGVLANFSVICLTDLLIGSREKCNPLNRLCVKAGSAFSTITFSAFDLQTCLAGALAVESFRAAWYQWNPKEYNCAPVVLGSTCFGALVGLGVDVVVKQSFEPDILVDIVAGGLAWTTSYLTAGALSKNVRLLVLKENERLFLVE